MERFKDLPRITLSESDKLQGLELKIGDVYESAEIAVTDNAWVELFERKEDGVYRFLNHQGISQHGDSKNKPKRFHVYVFGVVDDKSRQSLVYAQSIHDDTNLVNIVRLTSIPHVTKYRSLTYLD